jgi:hypothetical protein
MDDRAQRAAQAVADEVRNGRGRIDGREELAQRIEQAVIREWHRPIVGPRRMPDDLSITADWRSRTFWRCRIASSDSS